MKTLATLAAAVPAAALALGACTSAPEFTQFHTPSGPPIPAVENQFLNDVQHRLDRPLDNDMAVAAGIAASLRCLRYESPLFAQAPDPLASVPNMPGLSSDDREMVRVAMEMATADSGLCRAHKAKEDQDAAAAAAEAAQVKARADAEAARARAEQQARKDAARKTSQTATTTTTPKQSSSGSSSDDDSSSSGTSCEPSAPAKANSQHVITNKNCPEINSAKQSAQQEYQQKQQSRSGGYSGYNGDPQSGEPARQYRENQKRCASGVGPCLQGN